PFVAMSMTGDLVTGSVDAADLLLVVVRTLAGEGRRTDNREAGRDVVPVVEFQQSLRILELTIPPLLSSASRPRTIGDPLSIIIPEEDQDRRLTPHTSSPHQEPISLHEPPGRCTHRVRMGYLRRLTPDTSA